MIKVRYHILPLCIIVALSILLNMRHINEPPAYIHAWTQADHYSLALGFQHNGGDIFHPQTLIYNKQWEGACGTESLVTACDLPLHHWVTSALMTLMGSRQPWVFRGWTLIVAIMGLWALYFFSFLLTNSRAKSLLVSMVAATSPLFAYYSASFLSTVPALSMAMGGLLFYALYLQNDRKWALFVSVMLFTLAMMTRTSFAVLWVAVACFQVLRIWRHEVTLRSSWLPFVVGAVLFVAWWLWSMHLRQQYGSLFLGGLVSARSMEDVKMVMRNVHDGWRFHYFQRLQHWLYVVVAVGTLIFLILKRKKTEHTDNQLSLWWLLLIWLFGESLFVMAMLLQFCDHDYYFLDSLFLPILMLLVLLLKTLPNPSKRWIGIMYLVVVLIVTTFMTVEACNMQKIRRLKGVESLQTALRYQKANKMLEEAGLGSRNLKFLTMFSYPQNLPFVMMDREGYAIMWTKPKLVAYALTFNFDYIIVEDEVYRREFDEAPDVLSRLRRLAGNGELSVGVLSDKVLHPTADHFFECDK